MNETAACPYGPAPCDKILELEKRLDKLEERQMKIIYLLYATIGIIAAELGVVLI